MRASSGEKVNNDMPRASARIVLRAAVIAPWLVLVFCLALSWLLWNVTQQQTQSKLQDNFDFNVRQAVTLTEQRVLAQEQILRGVRGLFVASDKVERNEFHDYVATLHLAENYPGIQGVGYALIVPHAEKTKHTEAVRKESGHPEYALHPEGERDFYTSIVYLEPFSGRNLRAFGYDMYSEPVRRAAMEQARDTGMASLSGKVLLVQETAQHPQAGFLIYLPVYRNGAPHETVQQRRANIIGWVYSPFRMNDLAQGMYGERAKDLDIEIYDGEKVAPDTLMYDANEDRGSGIYQMSDARVVKMKNHVWTLLIHSTPLFISHNKQNEPLFVGVVGIGFSLLFTILTWLLVTGRERAIPYAQEMNRELILKEQALKESSTLLESIIENIPNMIFLKRANDLRFELFNRAGEVLLGHSREEMIGKNDYDFFPREQAELFSKKDREALRQNSVLDIPEEEINTANGIRYLHTRKLPLRDNRGEPKYLLGISEDITERKLTEISLIKSNRALAALSAVNHSLVHSADEHELLSAVCHAIVRQSNYRMAWVGYLEQDAEKSIRPIAQDGVEEGYLARAAITWADTARGRGPTGRAARSGLTQIVQNIQTDASMLPWRSEAAKRGMASNIALPLTDANKVFGVLTIYSDSADAFSDEEVKLLEEMSNDLTFGINSLRTRQERNEAQEKIKQQLAQLKNNLADTIKAITTIVELRDPYTAGHEARVAELAEAIAKEMGLADEQAHGIHLAGEVHDLGKIQVPAEILSMPRRLTEIEYSLIKCHPQAGYDILKDIDFPWPIAQMVLQHHERLDGSGYPQGLKGDAIIIEARILAVADVVEAMSSHRPYRAGLGIKAALAEISSKRGIYFDPQVVDACLSLFNEQHYSFNA